jgi:hypothetical protein
MTYRNRLIRSDGDTNWVHFNGNGNSEVIRDIISKINLSGKFLFIIDVFGMRDIDENKNLLPFDVYPEIFEYKKQAEDNNLKFIIVFEHLVEAPSYKYDIKFHVDEISNNLKIPTNQMIMFTGAHHQFDEDIKVAISTMIFISNLPFKNTSATLLPVKHFLSLSRFLRSHRIAASVEVLDRGLDKLGVMSIASGHASLNQYELNMIPDRYKNCIPMYVDGVIDKDFPQQHSATVDSMNTAFVNVVHETSFDYNFNYNGHYRVVWNATTYTEKTIKPFAWGQIPIFIATQDHDKYLRELGFDLFDDIIDQSYNQETDPMLRIKRAIDELEKICMWTIEKCVEFKQKNIQRFIDNRNLAEKVVGSRSGDSAKSLQKVLDII